MKKEGIKTTKKVGLEEAREICQCSGIREGRYGDFVVRTCWGFTLVFSKDFEIDEEGYIVDPTIPKSNHSLVVNTRLGLTEADSDVFFGKFWESKQGQPFFELMEPEVAPDIAIIHDFGNYHNRIRLLDQDYPCVAEGVKYMRRFQGRRRGSGGTEVLVVPLGFEKVLHDKAAGAEQLTSEVAARFEKNAQAIRARYREQKAALRQATAERLERERISAEFKQAHMSEISAYQTRLDVWIAEGLGEKLSTRYDPRDSSSCVEVSEIIFEESYLQMGWYRTLYSSETMLRLERWFEELEEKHQYLSEAALHREV